MVGDDEATAEKKMNAVMAIETEIAKASYDQVKLRDVDANYHKMTYGQLVEISWHRLGQCFPAFQDSAFDAVDVGQPRPIHAVERFWLRHLSTT